MARGIWIVEGTGALSPTLRQRPLGRSAEPGRAGVSGTRWCASPSLPGQDGRLAAPDGVSFPGPRTFCEEEACSHRGQIRRSEVAALVRHGRPGSTCVQDVTRAAILILKQALCRKGWGDLKGEGFEEAVP
jgi:hypothetical protein